MIKGVAPNRERSEARNAGATLRVILVLGNEEVMPGAASRRSGKVIERLAL
jgi:hypothetical protein